MKRLKHISKSVKVALFATVIAVGAGVGFGFSDNYFEISKNLDIYATLFRELNIFYVDETNPGELVKTSIDEMLKSLDPYTNYIPESDIEDYRFMTTGQYGGIGALIRKHGDYVHIAEPYEGFPAYKSGLMAGDKILEVDGKSVKGKKTGELSKILKGQPGTEITLLVERQGTDEPIKAVLKREEIKINDVPYHGMLNEKVGYIKLTSFTETASKEVRESFRDLKNNQGMEALVFDLRGNGGGLLREAVNIVNMFVEKDQEVVFTRGKVKEWDRSHKALNQPEDLDIPVVILIDGGSASASEIVSGALQDLDRAVLVGNKSFGKGLVQQTRNLVYNAKLKVTVAKYYIPSGRCIQKLDYSHKKNGKAEAVPDSLIKPFQTRNGRTVFDGEGITPDMKVEPREFSLVAGVLMNNNLIFDFATDFRLKHDSIESARDFKLTPAVYEEFKAWVNDKDYSYTSPTQELMEELKEVSEEDETYTVIQAQLEAMEAAVEAEKKNDLEKYRDEITELLENEIISRYYYQRGRVEASLANDPDVDEALQVLGNKDVYSGILAGTYKADEND